MSLSQVQWYSQNLEQKKKKKKKKNLISGSTLTLKSIREIKFALIVQTSAQHKFAYYMVK